MFWGMPTKVTTMTGASIATGPTSTSCTTETRCYLLSRPQLPLPGAELSSPEPKAQLPGLLPGNRSSFGESCQVPHHPPVHPRTHL